MPSREDLTALVSEPERYLLSPDPVLARMAVTALDRAGAAANLDLLVALGTDAGPEVRTAVAEKLGLCGAGALGALSSLESDQDERVREATATAYGEIGDPAKIEWLIRAANEDPDRAVREAAVAALGAIGDSGAVEPLLDLMANGPPQVRRRAIAAITVFDDDRIEPAIRRSAFDRNPGVREAAEMVVGRQVTEVD
ncbi:MAG: HEAT repeat domain-containing protein [Acidimicrobiia bacterium]